jgi:quercetin 2,3-dioxygenase
MMMKILQIAKAGIAHPFGDERAVLQAFPAGISETVSDPFLMCDYFNMVQAEEPSTDPNHYPVDWHPHRGFSIASYLKTGTGRHADSLGNRITFATPGMQWMNTGSGVEHAEGGGAGGRPGERLEGFQIWINVRKEHKMDDPDYGTVAPEDIPLLPVGVQAQARVLAGHLFGTTGPFRTKVPFQMADIVLQRGGDLTFAVDAEMDTAILYVYEGPGLSLINGKTDDDDDDDDDDAVLVPAQSIVVLDASDPTVRTVHVQCRGGDDDDDGPTSLMLFVGRKIREPIAWRGPIVMNTAEQIRETNQDLRAGTFPPRRVAWNYRDFRSRPKEEQKTTDKL